MEKLNNIPVNFSVIEDVNEEFLRTTISVLSPTQTANNFRFDKKGIDQARATIDYLPVIGYFNGEDFEGHDMNYDVDDEGDVVAYTRTSPLGCVIKGSSRWMELPKDNGEKESYLVVDAYLWKRYKAPVEMVKTNSCNQSMEVNIENCKYNEEDGCYDVSEFTFSALTVLGKDTSPAFTGAKIRTTDNFSKDTFGEEYKEMINKLKTFAEGGENMENEKVVEPIVEPTNFELSFDDIRNKIGELLPRGEHEYSWIASLYSDKFIYTHEVYEDEKYVTKMYKQGYSISEGVVSLNEDKVEVVPQYLTQEEIDLLDAEKKAGEDKLKAENTDLQAELEEARDNYSALDAEVVELRAYKETAEFEKNKVVVDERLAEFEQLESIEGYAELVAEKYSANLDELIKEIKVFAYDNNVVLGKKKKKEVSKIAFAKKTEDNVPKEWDFMTKYNK